MPALVLVLLVLAVAVDGAKKKKPSKGKKPGKKPPAPKVKCLLACDDITLSSAPAIL